jgi:hypothetical protein
MKKNSVDAQVRKVLRKALNLVRAGWTRGADARTARGQIVVVHDPRAARFCSVGALRRAARRVDGARVTEIYLRALNLVKGCASVEPFFDLSSFNDDPTTTKGDVIKAFEGALKLVSR